jgi:hypothetical protein
MNTFSKEKRAEGKAFGLIYLRYALCAMRFAIKNAVLLKFG